MKTFADLKRDLTTGTALQLIAPKEHKFYNITRYVIKAQTNGVYLSPEKDATKGSFMELPQASLVEYDGEVFNIYDFWQRELTPDEKRILDNQPSRRPENKQQLENDLMTDGSQVYWADKRYFKELNAEYLQGHDWQKGLKYDWNDNKVWDKKIKGKRILCYKLIK